MIKLGTRDEIPLEGKKFKYTDNRVEMEGIVLRRPDGSLSAWRNECRHLPMGLDARAPYSFWDPEAEMLVCSSHGAVFHPGSGLCTEGPCQGSHLRSLPLKIEGDIVYLNTSAMNSFLDFDEK